MANRTLRRAYNGAANPADGDGGSVAASEQPEPITGDADGDESVDGAKPDVDGATNDASEPTGGAAYAGVVEIDPAQLDEFIANGGQRNDAGESTTTDGEQPRRRRARSDAGTTRGKRGGKAPQTDIKPLLALVHTWAPIMLKIPELAVSPKELDQLAAAFDEFSRHHEVPAVTEKRMSEVNLIIALGMVYGTRLVAFGKRKQNERKRGTGPQPVTPFPMQQTQVV